ncbi:uncharacterized protein SCHCODRAFT_02668963 [Schizophyllum commune H4-8]|nr:uncharacterized protein SCHCODRAFT_02668963 [Schizophyllum commune H4-8]KAI5891653.1 hypothetical protein SCHCODRAFT_02668963 [Schizophyllum commune H4-8]
MKCITFLIDGWDDIGRQSLYGTVAAGINQFPIVLGLKDMTGQRGSAEKMLEAAEEAIRNAQLPIEDMIATCTNNPTVMQSFRHKMEDRYFWMLTVACFLHGVDKIIGEICTYPLMKDLIAKANKVVTFFNGLHYWGRQLKDVAIAEKVTQKLKINCESRWYAIVLLAMSVQSHRGPLTTLCLHPDAQVSTNGYSTVSTAVVTTVFDLLFWAHLNQLITVVKPIVDVLGNCKSRQANLADCTLELIRCVRDLSRLGEKCRDGEDQGFLDHAREVFDQHFQKIITPLHAFALFVHPLTRNLAQKWKWERPQVELLAHGLHQYNAVKEPFVGGAGDGLEWWESLPVLMESHPLKAMAIMILSIIPHSAEVKQLFLALNGVQSVKRNCLLEEMFAKLAKVRNNLSWELYKRDRKKGKSTHRTHGHMHTRDTPGISVDLVKDLNDLLAWDAPLELAAEDGGEGAGGDRANVVAEAFTTLRAQLEDKRWADDGERTSDHTATPSGPTTSALRGETFAFDQLVGVEEGRIPRAIDEKNRIIGIFRTFCESRGCT